MLAKTRQNGALNMMKIHMIKARKFARTEIKTKR